MTLYLEQSELSQVLLDLAEELNVSPGKYQEAKDHYEAVGEWLDGEGSELSKFSPVIYAQGSFALGTAVRPLKDDDYDVDAVCLLKSPPVGLDQYRLKAMVGARLKQSEIYKRLLDEEGRRCWTLKYADASRFHLDVLPAIPHRVDRRPEAIHVTDNKEPNTFWGSSNPKGYQAWFKQRMQVTFDRLIKMAADARVAKVEDIPEFEIQTPLQRLIQILKRHRDVHYGSDDDKPISIIITTLAAQAYDNEPDLYDALVKVIPGMKAGIVIQNGVPKILNPVNPEENFADKWRQYPRKQEVFIEWLARVEAFGRELATVESPDRLEALLDMHFGGNTARAAMSKIAARKAPKQNSSAKLNPALTARNAGILPVRFLSWVTSFMAGHREMPQWIVGNERRITIRAIGTNKSGVRRTLQNGETLPKRLSLEFTVEAEPSQGEEVYWQVVNTGREAESNGQLRGKMMKAGKTTSHIESTLYTGRHWVECFFVKTNTAGHPELTARTGEFVVKIE